MEQERITPLLLCVYLFASLSLRQQGHLWKVMKVDGMDFTWENTQEINNLGHGKDLFQLSSESKMFEEYKEHVCIYTHTYLHVHIYVYRHTYMHMVG